MGNAATLMACYFHKNLSSNSQWQGELATSIEDGAHNQPVRPARIILGQWAPSSQIVKLGTLSSAGGKAPQAPPDTVYLILI